MKRRYLEQDEIIRRIGVIIANIEKVSRILNTPISAAKRKAIVKDIERRTANLQGIMDLLSPRNYMMVFNEILPPYMQSYMRDTPVIRVPKAAAAAPAPAPAPIPNIGNLPPLRPFNNNTRRRIAENIAMRNRAASMPLPPLIPVVGNLPPLRPFNNNTRRRINNNRSKRNNANNMTRMTNPRTYNWSPNNA